MKEVIKRSALTLGTLMALSLSPMAFVCKDSTAADCLQTVADPQAVNNDRVTCDALQTQDAANVAILEALVRKYARGSGLGQLRRSEGCLVAAAATGKSVWIGESSNPKSCSNDPSKAWPKSLDRSIRAEVLAWILADQDANKLLTHRGIAIGGALIEGKLDLRNAANLAVLKLNNCQMSDIYLSDAVTRTIDLSSSKIGSLDGTRLRVRGDLDLLHVSASGEVDLTGADIHGSLHAGGSQLVYKGDSLILASATIGESALFSGANFKGMVRATGATIKRDMEFIDVVFSDSYRNGLQAGYAKVNGNFWWTPSVIGKHTELDLVGASVGSLHFHKDETGWPHQNCLFLDGFEFLRLAPESPTDEPTLKKWLDRQPDRAHDIQSS
jgi:hypothetical protein